MVRNIDSEIDFSDDTFSLPRSALDEWKTAGSKKDAVNKAERLSERKGLPIEEEARINIM